MTIQPETISGYKTRTVEIVAAGMRPIRLTAPAYCHVAHVLERDGLRGYEPHALACALAAMQVSQGHFYDVGANAGVFSIVVAAALGRSCVAFEPTPDLADGIRNTAALHYLPIDVRQIAVGAAPGKATFYLSAKSDASNSLNPAFRKHAGEIQVTVETLDRSAPIAAAVLKIDTGCFGCHRCRPLT